MSEEIKPVEELTDEELDAAIANAGSEESEGSPEGSEEEAGSSAGDEAEAGEESEESGEPGSSEEESEIPDYVPEGFREQFKDGKHDAVYKAYRELERKLGENSELAPITAILKKDPQARERAIKAILDAGEQSAGKPDPDQGVEKSPLLQKIEKLEEEGHDPEMVGLMKDMEAQIRSQPKLVEQHFEQIRSQQRESLRQVEEKRAATQFAKDHNMDADQWVAFATQAEQLVQPTGEHGNYTRQDLDNAMRIIDPDSHERSLESQIRTKIMQELGRTKGEEELPSTSSESAATAVTRSGKKKLEELSPSEIENLSDDELDEMGESAGLWTKIVNTATGKNWR